LGAGGIGVGDDADFEIFIQWMVEG
jgi:hypothetical protein